MVEEYKKNSVRETLLKKYPSTEYGVWKIFGEDPNTDLGGNHSNPLLETVRGTYLNIVEYALNLNNFFQWGHGGDIIRFNFPKDLKNVDKLVFNTTRLKELNEEKATLKIRLAQIESEEIKIISGDEE